MKKILVIVLCLVFASFSFGQIEEQVEIRLLEVWVKVTDDDNKPITDLNQNDFEILIDGKKSEVQCFDSMSAAAPINVEETPTTESKRVGRKFLFYFDLLNTHPGDLQYLKTKVITYLNNSFLPQDEAMIFALLPNMKLGVVQKMTSEKQFLISVIKRMKGNPTLVARERTREKQLLEILYPADTTQENQPSANAGPRFMDTFHTARMMARSFAAEAKQQSKLTSDSFLTITDYLLSNPLEGRLVLVYISGGFSLRPGMQYHDLVQDAIEQQQGILTGDFRLIEHPSSDFQSEVRKVIGRLNRLNVTIYSIDAKGAVSYDQSADRQRGGSQVDSVSVNTELQDSLFFLAEETGGTAFLNSRSFDKAFSDISNDMDDQYLLCVTPPAGLKKGSYHPIKVKVNRPDTNVRHRKGFVED